MLLLVAELDLVMQQERNQVFADAAQKTGSALMDFAQTRAELLQRKPSESFEQYEVRISAENANTQALYSRMYSGEVARLRDGFVRRGLERPELDEFYQEPGSAIAMHENGRALFEMGAELRSVPLTGMIKGWLRRSIRPTLFSPSKR